MEYQAEYSPYYACLPNGDFVIVLPVGRVTTNSEFAARTLNYEPVPGKLRTIEQKIDGKIVSGNFVE